MMAFFARTRTRRSTGKPGRATQALRAALRAALTRVTVAALLLPASAGAVQNGIQVDPLARSVTFDAVAHPEAFEAGLPPDHQYHAVVNRDGSAASKALFRTSVPDSTLARVLRDLGAEDGGGVPMSAWNLRWVPFVPQPAIRVQGTRLSVTVRWVGSDGDVPLSELLADPGGEGIDLRFGGNEEHDHHWSSGCIVCLFSCPGGVVSNAAYTIRDHQRGFTLFRPTDRMPPEGTRVQMTFTLDPE